MSRFSAFTFDELSLLRSGLLRRLDDLDTMIGGLNLSPAYEDFHHFDEIRQDISKILREMDDAEDSA
ncbi:MAG: hypothetical protein LC667_18550 [Thioalkalivibrio sp.]|nr:hypothetical protein [Thioalkalivibrio sp.]